MFYRHGRCVMVAGASLLFASGAIAADDNESAPVTEPGHPHLPVDAESVTATFPGPLDSFSINLTIVNGSSESIVSFVLDGQRETDAITWDSMGSFSGPATLEMLNGEDTEVVVAIFSGFDPGEAVSFTGIDPDFTGDPSSGVTIGDIAGLRSAVETAGLAGDDVYEVMGSDVVAIIKLAGDTPVESASWTRIKQLYR